MRKLNVVQSDTLEPLSRAAITIPVLVDDVKTYERVSLARCTYFSIECDTPGEMWYLGTGDYMIPFIMIGLSGIITGPVIGVEARTVGGEFEYPEQIDALISLIEDGTKNLFLDTNEIWLPYEFLGKARRADIYRVGIKLFQAAMQYSMVRIGVKEFFDKADKLWQQAAFSEHETDVFKKWGILQREMSSKRYYSEKNKHRLAKKMEL